MRGVRPGGARVSLSQKQDFGRIKLLQIHSGAQEAAVVLGRRMHMALPTHFLTPMLRLSHAGRLLNQQPIHPPACRDARWGRMAEVYGEDPLLLSRMAAAYVRGLQGPPNAPYVKVGATCKVGGWVCCVGHFCGLLSCRPSRLLA